MCPENAFGATHTHPVCGQTCSGHTWTTATHSDINWTAWDGTSSFSGSYVYLTQDVTWTRSYSFTGTVYICLNGHTITCDDCDGIEVPSGASVFICDCVGGGKIVGADGWSTVWNSGRFYIYEGTIVGGIYNDGGIVNVRGGEILGNTEPAIINNGENVTVNVVGGKISSKNHAIDNYGSGYTINISGGEITSMSTSTYNGIDGNGTTINMSGGSVTGNCAITGAILNFSGGTITGNEYAVSNSECYLSGSGTITGPIAISAMEKVHACDVDGQNYYGGSTVKLIPATSFTGYSGVAVTDIPNAAVSRLFEMAADPNTGEDIWSLKYENSGMTFRGPRYKGNVVGNVYYGLYDDGELLLYGSGNSKSYTFDNYSHAPWNSYYSKIKKVTIGKNITYIGSYSFFGYTVTSVEMRADNLEIGDCCFDACTSLTDINFGSGKNYSR